jgi:hypothetical protein
VPHTARGSARAKPEEDVMTESKKAPGAGAKNKADWLGVWIAIGAGIGLAIGVLFGQIALGVGLGVGAGIVIGSVLASRGDGAGGDSQDPDA